MKGHPMTFRRFIVALWVLLVLLAIGRILAAQDRGWTPASKILAGTAALGILSDWTTTVDIARTHQREYGPGQLLIGTYPKLPTVNLVFAVNTVLLGVAADRIFTNKKSPILGLSWRNLFLGSITVVEGVSGLGNHHLGGLRYNFNF